MVIDNNIYSITYYSNNCDVLSILSYIYDILSKNSNIEGECISNIQKTENNDFENKKQENNYFHKIIPANGTYKLDDITINISDYNLNNETATIKYKLEFFVVKKVILSSYSKSNIIKFVENTINIKDKEHKNLFKNIFNNKLEKKKFSYYDWIFDTAIPKRSFDSLFLKENHEKEIKKHILEFVDNKTYKDYLKHGIPYKINILLHGSPGVGKTSLIHAIATLCNASICNLNINSDLSENEMIRAINAASNIDKTSILVIEDIDCIFADRKSGDTMRNKITLNGLLNSLDGFNNPEGLIVIITTNFPDKLDEALVRSGRIDMEIELTNLDKYQAKNMFLSFFNDEEQFEDIWKNIKNYNIEPSTLMQFLFSNRNNNIKEKKNELYDLLKKKYNKENNKNIYM